MCQCVGVASYSQVYGKVFTDDESIRAKQFGKSAAAAQHAWLLAAMLFVSMMSAQLQHLVFTPPLCVVGSEFKNTVSRNRSGKQNTQQEKKDLNIS